MSVDPKVEAVTRELEDQCVRLAIARGWVKAPPLRVSGDDLVPHFPFSEDRLVKLSAELIQADPPAREYMLRDANTGAGVYVRGKVGLLAATGGTGKTWAGTQLAVAQATGCPWFGSGGWAPVAPGPVLFFVAEEDKSECMRMIHYVVRAARLNTEELRLLSKNLDVVALTGEAVALTTGQYKGDNLPESDVAVRIRSYLRDSARDGRSYTLVIFDPLSRFEGPDVEKDPVAGTRFVQVVETFTTPECGRPSALIACHTRKKGVGDTSEVSADSIRGTTAIKDAVRWAATLEQQKRGDGIADLITLKIQKANGVPPQLTPLVLCRDQQFEGTLRVASPGELESNEELADKLRSRVQEAEDHRSRVLELIAHRPDPAWSRNELAKICGKKTLVLEAVRQLLTSGSLIEPSPGRLSIPREPVGTGKGTGIGEAAVQGGSPPPTAPFRGAEGREPPRLGSETSVPLNGAGTTRGTTHE